MRQLTKNEKRYLIIIAVIGFIFLNLMGFKFFTQTQERLQGDLKQYKTQLEQTNQILTQKDFWNMRKEWLDSHQPKFKNQGEAGTYLINLILNTSRQYSMTIADQPVSRPTPPGNAPYLEVVVPLKIKGTLENLVHCLAEIQQPEHFVAIKSLTLKSETDPSNVVCDLEAAIWYAPNS